MKCQESYRSMTRQPKFYNSKTQVNYLGEVMGTSVFRCLKGSEKIHAQSHDLKKGCAAQEALQGLKYNIS